MLVSRSAKGSCEGVLGAGLGAAGKTDRTEVSPLFPPANQYWLGERVHMWLDPLLHG